MRTTLKILLLLVIAYAPLKVYGQNDYARQLEVMTKANSLSTENKLVEALQLTQSNEELFKQDEITKFWYDWLVGVLLYRTEQYSKARPFIVNSISFIDRNRDNLIVSTIINYLPVYYFLSDIDLKLGEQKEVLIKELEHARYIYEAFNATDNPIYLKINSDLNMLDVGVVAISAMNNFFAQDYHKAIPQLIQVINFAKEHRPNNLIQLVIWIKTLGMAYGAIGDNANAEKYYLSALEVLESNNLQNDKVFRFVLGALSVLYCQVQNYDKANNFNGRAKLLFEKNMDFGDGYVRCLGNGAIIQRALGHNTVAKMYTDVALRQAKKNLNDTTSISSQFTGLSQFMKEDVNASSLDKNYFIQGRIIPYVTLLATSATLYSDLGYFPDAIRFAREAVRVSEEYGLKEALPYNNLGMLYFSKSKFAQASEWLLKAFPLCKTPSENDEIGLNTILSLYLSHDISTASYAKEVSSSMRQNIKDNFSFLSSEERTKYWKHFENYLPLINLAIYNSGNEAYYGSIYDNIIATKGLLLRSSNNIRDAVLRSGNPEDIEFFTQIGDLRIQLQTETDSLKRIGIRNTIEKLDKTLTRNVSSYADFAKKNDVNWNNIKNALSEEDIAMEFYNIPLIWGIDSIQTMDGEPRYCAVTLKKGYKYPHIIPLCKESEISSLENYDCYETDSIYHMIWEPLEEELKGVKNVYFSADRELHKIGIEYAMQQDGSRMGDKYNMYRLSSTRLLGEERHHLNTNTAVLYGGLRYDLGRDDLIAESRRGEYHASKATRAVNIENLRYGVQYLPGTKEEVEAIAKDFDATNSNKCITITDVAGTEESFRALANKDVSIIHLATHGFFWTEEETEKRSYVSFLTDRKKQNMSYEDKTLLRSGLFFSGANIGLSGGELPDDVEDGILTAKELADMNLGDVDMVVMSACQSGLGETSGEGVFGLQRGFKLAGANTLLMSLWKVDDAATKLLMTNFYKHYLSGKTKQESLKLAQQSLRNTPEYSDYEYWAAFILLDALN